MDISVLGPLIAARHGFSIVPSAAKPRTLLALLAAYSGRVIPVGVIVSELWESAPPPSAGTTVQTYILQLRRLIRGNDRAGQHEAKDVLRTEPGGYLLHRAGGFFDAAEHERLAAGGFEAMQAGDIPRARDQLQSALDLWRGPAFVDVQRGPRLSAQSTLLEESHRTVLERRIQADLQLGRHHELLGELAGLTAEQSTDERLHAHYMIALYRSDRRTQALAVFSHLRRALAEDLGLDPSPNITRLRQAILVADPALDGPNSRLWTNDPPTPVPAVTPMPPGRHPAAGRHSSSFTPAHAKQVGSLP